MNSKIPSSDGITQTASFVRHLASNFTYRFNSHASQSGDLVLVVGAPRSGTTLVQVLLGAHSKFFTAEQETGIFTWQDLFAPHRLFHGRTIGELQSKYGLIRSQTELLEVLARDGRQVSGKKYYVEKTPQHVLHLRRLLRLLPRALHKCYSRWTGLLSFGEKHELYTSGNELRKVCTVLAAVHIGTRITREFRKHIRYRLRKVRARTREIGPTSDGVPWGALRGEPT